MGSWHAWIPKPVERDCSAPIVPHSWSPSPASISNFHFPSSSFFKPSCNVLFPKDELLPLHQQLDPAEKYPVAVTSLHPTSACLAVFASFRHPTQAKTSPCLSRSDRQSLSIKRSIHPFTQQPPLPQNKERNTTSSLHPALAQNNLPFNFFTSHNPHTTNNTH